MYVHFKCENCKGEYDFRVVSFKNAYELILAAHFGPLNNGCNHALGELSVRLKMSLDTKNVAHAGLSMTREKWEAAC